MATEEKLIPVTNESELRIGMKVTLRNCRQYNRDHLGFMLLGSVRNERGKISWKHTSDCQDPPLMHFTFLAIPEGRLFRVEDGLDEKADERQRKLDEAAIYAARQLEKVAK